MQILMLALQPSGGIRTFFRYVYGHTAFADCVFTLIAPDQELSRYLEQYLPAGRIKLIQAREGHGAFMRQMRHEAVYGRYALIHSHGFSSGLLTELVRTGLDIPHLMTAHDVFLPAQFNGLKGTIKQWAMASLFRRMTAIHAVTADARKNLLEFFPNIPPGQIHDILQVVISETPDFHSGAACLTKHASM